MFIPSVIVALFLLFLGERLYWLFVGGIGFIVGMDAAASWMVGQPGWLIVLAAVLVGIVGALLAIFFQRLAVGLAGFVAGGYLAQMLAVSVLGLPSAPAASLAYIAGGVIFAILAVVFLDWALIGISALVGAAMIAQWAAPNPMAQAVIGIVLFLVGASVQAAMLRGRRVAPREIT